MTELLEIAARHNLRVVEDAAQAQGATLDGRAVGHLGDAAGWSFYPSRTSAPPATPAPSRPTMTISPRRVRLARNQGSLVRSVHELVGSNSRLDPIQAAILSVKLRHLEAWNTRRRAIAARYMTGLGATSLRLPVVAAGCEHVWHQFVVRHPDRDGLRATLTAAGIETLIHYETPPHLQAAYGHLGLLAGSLPIAEELAAQILSLPIDPLLSDEAIDAVIDTILAWDRGQARA